MRTQAWPLFLALTVGSVGGCGGSSSTTTDMGAPPDQAGGGACMHTVACTDNSVQQLSLFRSINTGKILNTNAGGVFTSTVDATAGGVTPTKAFVYAKFTDQGLERVEVGDEDAFTSTEWDIAFRRFVIRLNSGVSGPSCVTAARTPSGTTFAALTTAPGSLSQRTEEYFTESCDYVPDGSGLMSPGVALQSFWEYPGCVKMTGNVFVVTRADGRKLKLQVKAYYSPDAQKMCDDTGMVSMSTPSGSGNVTIDWAFLP